MERKLGSEIQTALRSFVNHPQVNLSITSVILFVSGYFTVVSIFGQHIWHPMTILSEITITGEQVLLTVISLVILLIISLISARAANLLNLSPLVGSLVIGIAITNIHTFSKFFYIHPSWDIMVRRLGLICIIIRWGFAIRFEFIRKNLALPFLVPLITGLCEAAVIALAAIFIFDVSAPMSALLGFVLSCASGVVTGPTIVQLQNEELGTDKEIPALLQAIGAFDPLNLLIVFTAISAGVFTHDSVLTSVFRAIGVMFLCAIAGHILGLILWWFPRVGDYNSQLARILLAMFIGIPVINGMFYAGIGFAGILFTLSLCATCGFRWRQDSDEAMYPVEKAYANIWNLICSPLLFVLVGMKYKFALMAFSSFWTSAALVAMGALCRFITTLLVTSRCNLQMKEQLVVTLSLLPKGTVQGALSPNLLLIAKSFPEHMEEAYFIVFSAIVSILLTASIGRLLFSNCAPELLQKEMVRSITITDDLYAPSKPSITKVSNGKLENFDTPILTFKQFKHLHQTYPQESSISHPDARF